MTGLKRVNLEMPVLSPSGFILYLRRKVVCVKIMLIKT